MCAPHPRPLGATSPPTGTPFGREGEVSNSGFEDFHHPLPQPPVRRLRLHVGMPVEVRVQGGHGQGEGEDLVAELFTGDAGVGFRHGENQVGAADDAAGGEVVLAAEADVALVAVAAQLHVFHAGAGAAGAGEDVVLLEVGLDGQAGAHGGVALARDDDERIDADGGVVDVFGQGQEEDVDGGVQGSHGEFGLELAAVGADGGDLDMGGLPGDALHECGQEGGFEHVAHGDGEFDLAGGGVEAGDLVEGDFQVAQGAAHGLDDAAGQGCGDHGLALALEQGVSEHFTQAGEGVADGGLGEVELAGGLGDAAFGVDGVQHHQEIEVHAVEMHGAYDRGCRGFI